MPIEQVMWKVGEKPKHLPFCNLANEKELETMICNDVSILNEQWMLIGRQVSTSYGKSIDLVAIDSTGSLVIIELKKHKTPREVVAQAIDYASWVQKLDSSDVSEIFRKFSREHAGTDVSLDVAFFDRFGIRLEESDLNSSHQIVIVASQLDSSSERIVEYLNNYNVPLNVVFFRVFRDGDSQYLSRAWFIDPADTKERASAPKSTGPWNGEYYVSFGHNMGRDWEDARKYGFISAGGGRWYSKTLGLLEEGRRIWVNIPKTGYVGVGVVEGPAVKVDEFKVKTDKGSVPLLQAPINAHYHKKFVDDEDKAEYVVKVRWLRDVPVKEAISEVGLFGNQNTVCKPTTPKWDHTVERLKVAFNIKNQ